MVAEPLMADAVFPTFETRLVTPDDAKQWLANTPPGANRPLSKPYVEMYARIMDRGDWVLNGDVIRINSSGGVDDGQHRLHAVIAHGRPVMMSIAHNCQRKGIDAGKVRTVANQFAIDGVHRSSRVVAALRWLRRYTLGQIDLTSNAFAEAVDYGEMRDLFDSAPEIAASVACTGGTVLSRTPQSVLAFVHFMASKTSPEKATEFCSLLRTGAELPDTSPVLALIKAGRNMSAKGVQLYRDKTCAITVKAWLMFEDGLRCKVLRIGPAEPFPRFRTNWPDPD